ncbi:class I SAM-dependent methyltransferase [Frankia sp. CiP3]|uniref:class I SAM-dependent methyltransferase n=1 Tax=Frankia sp. CiP3 TaxID=2880971 RepID=UPI001EF6FDD1|nr:class I SAM-dependent methyltransferase [Frankia sp. CiP3]
MGEVIVDEVTVDKGADEGTAGDGGAGAGIADEGSAGEDTAGAAGSGAGPVADASPWFGGPRGDQPVPRAGEPGAADASDGTVEAVTERTLQPLLLHSLAELREVWLPLVEAVRARSVVEIGSESGVTSSLLVDMLRRHGGGRLLIVDPDPRGLPDSGEAVEVVTVRGYSPQALDGLPLADAYLIDGDHNFPTVSAELRTVDEAVRAHGGSHFPLVILHDVGWPAGRRDQYYVPSRIPRRDRQPYSWDHGVRLDNAEAVRGGFRGEGAFAWALTEGGPRNGVRTAVEDFIADRPELRFHLVSPIFGLGVVVDRRASWAARVEELLIPWVRNSLLTRMERNRLDLYLYVIRMQDEMTEAARRRQREWARFDATLAEHAARELSLLDALAQAERALEAERGAAQQLRAALGARSSRSWPLARVARPHRPPVDEPALIHAARTAGAALRSRVADPRLRAARLLLRGYR